MQENQKPLRGRPNQGKTQTIKERKVDVYLPTHELVEDWKKAAESAGLPLSKYVFEVVERHRRNIPETSELSKDTAKKMEEMESELASLRSKYNTLDMAFKRVDAEKVEMSTEYSKALLNAVDSDLAKDLVRVFVSDPGQTLSFDEIIKRMGIDEYDYDRLTNWSFAKDFLSYVGVLEHVGMTGMRWKHPDMRGRTKP